MIYKALFVGILATVCYADHQKAPKSDQDNPIITEDKVRPIPYNFEYNTKDQNGTSQFRKESSDENGKVQGRYGYKDIYGIERIVEYVADENGYRAQIKTNEPGTENMSPAAVQLNAQPMSLPYHELKEDQKSIQKETNENTIKYLSVGQNIGKLTEAPLSNQLQNQKYSTVVSDQLPSYRQYTFYGQEEPNVATHKSVSPQFALGAQSQEQLSPKSEKGQSISLGLDSTMPVSYFSSDEKQQNINQKPRGQIIQFYTPNIHYGFPEMQYQQQAKPEQTFHSTIQKHSYASLPPHSFQTNTDALVHQYIALNNQETTHPKSISRSTSLEYAPLPSHYQQYPFQGRQIVAISS